VTRCMGERDDELRKRRRVGLFRQRA
jgi:hypothetical protein